MNIARIPAWFLFCLWAAGSGCATRALWEKSTLDSSNQPADPARLQLFYSAKRKDVLAVYQEYSERKDSARPRAYWVYENQTATEQRRRPRFVSVTAAHGLAAVPVFDATHVPPQRSPDLLCAVLADAEPAFTLCSGEQELQSFRMPVYDDGKGKLERMALTPLAATADATLIGGYIGVAFLYGLGQSGYSTSVGK